MSEYVAVYTAAPTGVMLIDVTASQENGFLDSEDLQTTGEVLDAVHIAIAQGVALDCDERGETRRTLIVGPVIALQYRGDNR